MKKLLIATRNEGKLKEFSNFLSDLPVEILSLKDLGITQDFEERGKHIKKILKQKHCFMQRKADCQRFRMTEE